MQKEWRAIPEFTAVMGQHEHLATVVLPSLQPPLRTAVDLGAGAGRFSLILQAAGYHVLAVEPDIARFQAAGIVLRSDIDFNAPGFAASLPGPFGLAVAIEVIEHLESPIGFLRGIGQLLCPGGLALVTTPNVDSIVTRLRLLLSDTLRGFDEKGEPTHVMPVFRELFVDRWLPLAGLGLRHYSTYPERRTPNVRPLLRPLVHLATRLTSSPSAHGESHVFVLRRCPGA